MSDKLLRITDILSMLGIGRTTLWRWEKSGFIPTPIRKPGGDILGWMESDINEWIQKNKR